MKEKSSSKADWLREMREARNNPLPANRTFAQDLIHGVTEGVEIAKGNVATKTVYKPAPCSSCTQRAALEAEVERLNARIKSLEVNKTVDKTSAVDNTSSVNGKVVLAAHQKAWLEHHPDRTAEWLKQRLRDGFHVHHIDGNAGNNESRNLALVEGKDHMHLHFVGVCNAPHQKARVEREAKEGYVHKGGRPKGPQPWKELNITRQAWYKRQKK